MSGSGHSLPGRADSRSSHVRGAPKAEVSRVLRLIEAPEAFRRWRERKAYALDTAARARRQSEDGRLLRTGREAHSARCSP
jgi:hypothetical protein